MTRAVGAVVAMTGLSAAGKSTVGREIAHRLGFAFVDEDDFLEASFPVGEAVGADERSRLSRLADVEFQAAAVAAREVVLASFWRHPSRTDAGTPTDWLSRFEARVEAWCVCSPEVAIDRFLARRRHPAHGDARWDRGSGLANLRRVAALGPIGCGELVRMSTHPWPGARELDRYAARIERALAGAADPTDESR